jgi:hypothetical protein
MTKHALYFSHDSNARTDEKIVDLRMCLGWEGYGLYWAVVEMLSESTDYKMKTDCKRIAFTLGCSLEVADQIINNFNLFIIDGDCFSSESLNRRMELKSKKSDRAKRGAEARWHKKDKTLSSTGEVMREKPQAYIIICEGGGEKFVKIGITTEYISRRFSGKMPYEYKVHSQFFSQDYTKIETELTVLLKSFSYVPKRHFPGINECYSMESLDKIGMFSSVFKVDEIHNAYATQCKDDATHMQRNAIKKENKEKKQINKESKTKDRAFALEYLSRNNIDWITTKMWEEWIDHKIRQKTKITDRALSGNIVKLKKVPDPNAAIVEACDRNWKDIVVHELPTSNPQGKKGQQGQDYDIAWEHIMTRIRNPNAPLTDIEKVAVGKMGGIDGFKRMTERELSFRKQGLKADFIGHFENEKGKL